MPRKRFSLKLLAKNIRYKKKGSSASTVEIQCSCKLCSLGIQVNPAASL